MKAVVLGSVAYSDNSYMLKLFTDEKGVVSVSVHTGGKSAKMKKSFLLPLTLLEVELAGRENNEVKYISDCRVYRQCNDLIANPMKMLGSQFLCEVTEKALKFQTSADGEIFDFVEEAIVKMDELKGDVESWMIVYMYGLMQQVGIVPDLSDYELGMSLDLDEGRVVRYGKYARETEALVKVLGGGDVKNDFLPLAEFLIKYFQRHLEGFGIVKSLGLFE